MFTILLSNIMFNLMSLYLNPLSCPPTWECRGGGGGVKVKKRILLLMIYILKILMHTFCSLLEHQPLIYFHTLSQ